jgi:hypothetical protein
MDYAEKLYDFRAVSICLEMFQKDPAAYHAQFADKVKTLERIANTQDAR